MAGIIRPDSTHLAATIPCRENRHAVINWCVPLKTESCPLAITDHPAVSTKRRTPLSPFKLHRFAPVQGRENGLLHFIDDKFRVFRHPPILLGCCAPHPNHRGITDQRWGVVSMRCGDHQAIGRNPVLGQALGQAIRNLLRHPAIIQRQNRYPFLVTYHQRTSP